MTIDIYLRKDIKDFGDNVTVRNLKTREVLNYNFLVPNDYECVLSTHDKKYVTQKLLKYNKDFKNIISILSKDINSRQAVLLFNKGAKKLPECFISIQFLIRNSIVYSLVTSRSLDVINKLNCDVSIVRELTNKILKKFKLQNSIVEFSVGSLHYYY